MPKDYLLNLIVKYRYEALSFVFTFLVAATVFLLSDMRFPNDDQFITYRYIDNLIYGKELVFNFGERVMGFTSPLFTLVGSLFKFLFKWVYTPTIISWLNIFLLSFSSTFFFRICRRFLSLQFSALAVLIFAFNLSRTIPEGMETPLFLLAAFIFLDSLFGGRYYTSSIFLSLAILTRPDAGLIAILALVFWWQKAGFQKMVKLVTVCVAVALPWFVFSTLYYGSLIPQSLMAKTHTADIVNQSGYQAFKVQLSDISRTYWGKIFDPDNIPLQVSINLIPVFVLAYVGIKKKITKDNWIIFAIPIFYLVAFGISNPVMWPWYLSQVLPFWILASVMGAAYFLSGRGRAIKAVAFMLLLAGPIYWWLGRSLSNEVGSKEPLFKIGQYLKGKVAEGETIGINNLGIVGYTTGANIYDFFGLMNYTSTAFYPVSECGDESVQYQIPSTLIMHARPDWLVLSGPTEITPCFRESSWFKRNYVAHHGLYGAEIFKLVKQ